MAMQIFLVGAVLLIIMVIIGLLLDEAIWSTRLACARRQRIADALIIGSSICILAYVGIWITILIATGDNWQQIVAIAFN